MDLAFQQRPAWKSEKKVPSEEKVEYTLRVTIRYPVDDL